LVALLRLIGNAAWLILFGWWLALLWVVFGLINLIFIITIPFAVAAFRLANLSLWPFGRTAVPRDAGAGWTVLTIIGNVIWILFGGLWLALGHLLAAAALAVTIIGIPFAVQCLKLAWLSLVPLGQRVVSVRRAV
jgi:uncharacterized membrane protein YccF (DUF307 family)